MMFLKTTPLLVLALLLAYPAINGQPGIHTDSLRREAERQKAVNKKAAATLQLRYFVIKAEQNTFGYDIYANGNLYIHQPTVPGQGGNSGFADTTSAGRTARLVIKKICNGENPPTVTVRELNRLLTNGKKQ